MSSFDLDKLQVHLEPPLSKKPRRGRRSVSLITENGMILNGIAVHYPKSAAERIDIPDVLTVQNRPEYGETVFPLSDLNREALRMLIQEKLRYRPDPSHPPQWDRPGESVSLLTKARTTRRGHKN